MRGDGATTRQILALKQDGWFIVPTMKMLDYTKHLARYVGRQDVVVLYWRDALCRVRGRTISDYDIDHAAFDLMSRRDYGEFNDSRVFFDYAVRL